MRFPIFISDSEYGLLMINIPNSSFCMTFDNVGYLLICILVSCSLIYWMNVFHVWYLFQVFKGVLSCALQEVKDLYHLLEHEFLPLDLASKTQVFLTKISNLGGRLSSALSLPEVQLSKYIPALEKLATLRLLQQVH